MISAGNREGVSGRPRVESIGGSLGSTCLMLGEAEDKDVLIGFGKWRSPVTWKRAASPMGGS